MSDMIDRQAAIDAVRRTPYHDLIKENMVLLLMDLPSAEPVKAGKWIKEDLTGYMTPGGNGIWHCSECNHQEVPYPHARLTNYCPDCGAKMEAGHE